MSCAYSHIERVRRTALTTERYAAHMNGACVPVYMYACACAFASAWLCECVCLRLSCVCERAYLCYKPFPIQSHYFFSFSCSVFSCAACTGWLAGTLCNCCRRNVSLLSTSSSVYMHNMLRCLRIHLKSKTETPSEPLLI